MINWQKLWGLLKNSPQAIARTFSNPRAKIGTGIAKGKKVYGQATTYLPVLKTKVGKFPMWGWITLLVLLVLFSIILTGYWMVRWVITNAPKLITFNTLEHWDLQAAVGLLIVFVLIAYMTRKKKPKAPAKGTQTVQTAVAQAAATTTPPTPTNKKKDEEEGLSRWGFLGIALMFCLLHALWYYAAGPWWFENIVYNPVSIVIHLILVTAVLNLPKGKVPPNNKMAWFAIAVVFVVFLPYQACNTNWKGGQTQASTTRTTRQSVNITTEQGIIPKGTLKYPRGGSFENKEVAERVLAGQWDLLAACYRESGGMKQFNSKGQVIVYKNIDEQTKKVTSIDRGACMINSQHDARLKDHPDANTLVGNLQYAMILYKERGMKPWTPHLTKEEFVFEIPVDEDGIETNTFVFPYGHVSYYSLIPSAATTVIATDLDDVEHELDIYPLEERPPISGGVVADRLKSYRFKSKDGKPSVVTVTYRYK